MVCAQKKHASGMDAQKRQREFWLEDIAKTMDMAGRLALEPMPQLVLGKSLENLTTCVAKRLQGILTCETTL